MNIKEVGREKWMNTLTKELKKVSKNVARTRANGNWLNILQTGTGNNFFDVCANSDLKISIKVGNQIGGVQSTKLWLTEYEDVIECENKKILNRNSLSDLDLKTYYLDTEWLIMFFCIIGEQIPMNFDETVKCFKEADREYEEQFRGKLAGNKFGF